MKTRHLIAVVLAGLLTSTTLATGATAQESTAGQSLHDAVEHSGPTAPTDAAGWAGSMLIIVAAMFLMAAMVGPIVRAEMPEEPADAHGHDHAHADHGHGHEH